MKHKVRGRDGVLREIDDNCVLLDSESYVITLNGHRAGDRSGFLYADDERVELARIDAYEEYAAAIRETFAATTGPTIKPNHPPPSTLENPETARAAAYRNTAGCPG